MIRPSLAVVVFAGLILPAFGQDMFSDFKKIDAARQAFSELEDAQERAAKAEELRGMTQAFLTAYGAQADKDSSSRMLVARAHYLNANFHMGVDLAVADRSSRLAQELLKKITQERRSDQLARMLLQQVGMLRGKIADRSRAEVARKKREALVGKKAPAVGVEEVLDDKEGKGFRLFDQRGKVVILSFWATWHGPSCRRVVPFLGELQKKHPELVILGLTRFYGRAYVPPEAEGKKGEGRKGLSAEEERDFNRRCAKAIGLSYPIAFSEKAAKAYHVTGIPQLVLVDKKGVVRHVQVGARRDNTTLEKLVAECLGEAAK